MKSHRLVTLVLLLLLVGFSCSAWGKTVTLSWDESPSSITGYKIYYDVTSTSSLNGTGSAQGDSPIDVGNRLSFEVTGLPDASDHYFAVTAYDDAGNESVYSNTVHSDPVSSANVAPVLVEIGNKTILEGATLNFTLNASDADGDSLTYAVSGLPNGAGFNQNIGVFTWPTSFDQQGRYNLTFTVSDGIASDSETIEINVTGVNQAPVLSTVGNQTVLEGATLNFTLNGSDADGDSLTYAVSGLPNGAGFNQNSGAFTWPTSFNQEGRYDLTFTVSDGVASDSDTIEIIVTGVNQTPVLEQVGNKAVSEGDTQYIPLQASDADNDNLTYSFSPALSGASMSAGGLFSWSTTSGQRGVYSLTFTVSDGAASVSETIEMTVTAVNRAPVVGQIDDMTVSENQPRSVQVVATDPDNDNLTYSFSPALPGATMTAEGLFNWTPTFSQSGAYNLTFSVSDGTATTTQNVAITVADVNRAPVLNAIGAQSLAEGADFNLVVSATDPDSDSLTYTLSGRPEMAVFTPSTRSFSWTPGSDDAGTHEVTFTVSDGSMSASETVFLTVADGNEAPVLATIGSQSVSEGQTLEFTLSATDNNNDSLSYTATPLPPGAEFNNLDGRFRWTPDYTQAGHFNVVFSASDNTFSDSETVSITVLNSNRPPQISGTPGTSVMATASYSFTPVVVDPDSDTLTFTIENKPVWAEFNNSNGRLSGTPDNSQIGTFSAIRIQVSDADMSAMLAPFAITVAAYMPLDSDGDGIEDHLDAFPQDATEWLDTDGDQIGNNSDSDDDNDGVADIRDGAPLDATRAGWVINAISGSGGYITPAGETAVLYGGSQRYELSAMAGYYINDVLIDGVSVGLNDYYVFENVAGHHRIEAVFTSIPLGLSYDPLSRGLVGIERVDGGDDRTNLVDGMPKLDIDYRFEITLRDSVVADQRRVFLVLNGYKYPMALTDGTLNHGGDYAFATRLGAAASHQYYFEAEDLSGQGLWRYPHSGYLNGPVVNLLNGKNLVGVAADINAHGLGAIEAFSQNVYRWKMNSDSAGAFETVNAGAPVASGEGYVLNQTSDGTLPDHRPYGQIDTSVYLVEVQDGWNLISNPYGGNISLAAIEVQRGNEPAVAWSDAVTDKLVVDVIYSYLGDDWGKNNEFSSAFGDNSAVLVPWIGYWVYVNPSAEAISLLIPKPLQ